ncbi:MAG: hypothetical protein OHK0046_00520 [Anaerolineae bacterium]
MNAPYITTLAESGAFSWQAETVFPPATLPAHASLLSGVAPAEHGQDDNVVRPCGAFDFPTWLSTAAAEGHQTAMVAGKAPLCQFNIHQDTAFMLGAAGDRSVVEGVIAMLEDGYTVILAHFPNPDYFGHIDGWMSATYLRELENTDRQIGRLLDAVDDMGLRDDMLILLTADHGGHGTAHGQNIPEDMRIPWIISGPGVIDNADLSTLAADPVSLLDAAPTVLWALDMAIPQAMQGRVICEAFGRTPSVHRHSCR